MNEDATKKQMYVTYFMLFMACLLCFTVGYGIAIKQEINDANAIVTEYLETHNCFEKTKEELNNEERYGFNFNLTLYEEGIESENTTQ